MRMDGSVEETLTKSVSWKRVPFSLTYIQQESLHLDEHIIDYLRLQTPWYGLGSFGNKTANLLEIFVGVPKLQTVVVVAFSSLARIFFFWGGRGEVGPFDPRLRFFFFLFFQWRLARIH